MTTMSSPVEKPRKHPFGESERDSSGGQQAEAVDRDDQASPAKDTLREGRKANGQEIRFLQKSHTVWSDDKNKLDHHVVHRGG